MKTTIENQAARGDSLQRAGSDDATENFCEICCARKVAPPEYPNDSVCQCKGLQPYAMSTYPGEYRLVKSHPNSGGHQWYKRADVDAKLEELEKRADAHQNDQALP
jgi:hypothetical protein